MNKPRPALFCSNLHFPHSSSGSRHIIVLGWFILFASCAAAQTELTALTAAIIQADPKVRRDPALVLPNSPAVIMVDDSLLWSPDSVATYAGVSPQFPAIRRDMKDVRASNATLALVIGPVAVVNTPRREIIDKKNWSWTDVAVTLNYSVFYRQTPAAPFMCLATFARASKCSPYSETQTAGVVENGAFRPKGYPERGVETTTTFYDKWGRPSAELGARRATETRMQLAKISVEELAFQGKATCLMDCAGYIRSLPNGFWSRGSDLLSDPALGLKIQPLVIVDSSNKSDHTPQAVTFMNGNVLCETKLHNPFPVPLRLFLELGAIPASPAQSSAPRKPTVLTQSNHNMWKMWAARHVILQPGQTVTEQFSVEPSVLGLEQLRGDALRRAQQQLASSARLRVNAGGLDFRPRTESTINR